jgi:hypothetical protein
MHNGILGPQRFEYPANHIEADNRLSWFLGRLEDRFGDNAAYVHLIRDRGATARSLQQQYLARASDRNIMYSYIFGLGMVKFRELEDSELYGYCEDFCDTVNRNIAAFMKDKTRTLTVRLENIAQDFGLFWDFIGAEGDREAALSTWTVRHNATKGPEDHKAPRWNARKAVRFLKKLPQFYRQA